MAFEKDFFLGIEHSASGKSWISRLDERASRSAAAIAQQTDISEIIARVIAARGIEPAGARAYLEPTIRDLMPDPSVLTGMDQVADRIASAIEKKEKIALFGDYDVDGAASAALMDRYLAHFGSAPKVHIPDRIFEGYGPNIPAMDGFAADGVQLVVTLDCGTSSIETIAHARGLGLDVLVIDHHLSDGPLPEANALVNPNRADDVSGLNYLCAAGVVFMVLVSVNRVMRGRGHQNLPDLMALCDLVALATVCDVVPLVGLNRAFVARGLETMRGGSNPGIMALALAARISGPLNPYHLGFMIGPRINAGGRIGDAGLGAQLLSSDDEHGVFALAERLDCLNEERQRIEREAVDEAISTAEAEIGKSGGPPVLVLASESWHPGVVGLVAARLKERFSRPAFAIAMGRNGVGTGSGRSIAGVDMGRAVIKAVEDGLIMKGGGHAMAAGITLKQEQIGAFRSAMSVAFEEIVRASLKSQTLSIDGALSARAADPSFVAALETAGPFGAGSPTPIFAFPNHRVKSASVVGQGGHVRFSLVSDDGARLKGIAFRAADNPVGQLILNSGEATPLHVCGTLGIDHWQGREQVQIRLVDAADPEAGVSARR